MAENVVGRPVDEPVADGEPNEERPDVTMPFEPGDHLGKQPRSFRAALKGCATGPRFVICEHRAFAPRQRDVDVVHTRLEVRLLHDQDVVAGERTGEEVHRALGKFICACVESAGLVGDALEAEFERVVIAPCHVEREDGRPRVDERLGGILVVVLHLDGIGTRVEASESVAKQHDRLGAGKRLERVGDQTKTLLDVICPAANGRLQPGDQPEMSRTRQRMADVRRGCLDQECREHARDRW